MKHYNLPEKSSLYLSSGIDSPRVAEEVLKKLRMHKALLIWDEGVNSRTCLPLVTELQKNYNTVQLLEATSNSEKTCIIYVDDKEITIVGNISIDQVSGMQNSCILCTDISDFHAVCIAQTVMRTDFRNISKLSFTGGTVRECENVIEILETWFNNLKYGITVSEIICINVKGHKYKIAECPKKYKGQGLTYKEKVYKWEILSFQGKVILESKIN